MVVLVEAGTSPTVVFLVIAVVVLPDVTVTVTCVTELSLALPSS